MAGHGERLSRKKEQLITALLEKPTILAAALAVGINEKTARRWLADPDFLKSYRQVQRRLVECAVGRLQRSMEFGVNALLKLIKDGAESSQLGATKAVLEYGLKGVEVADIQERLEALEAKLLAPPTASRNGTGANLGQRN